MNHIRLNTIDIQNILNGYKTQFRLLAKGKNFKVDYVPEECNSIADGKIGGFYYFEKSKKIKGWTETENFYDAVDLNTLTELMSKQKDFLFNIGDILWIKEDTKISYLIPKDEEEGLKLGFTYLADNITSSIDLPLKYLEMENLPDWMAYLKNIPGGCLEEMARTFLKITNVRVERLQEITRNDISNEGCPDAVRQCEDYQNEMINWWINIWDSTTKKCYKWKDNPFVFVYEFEKVEKPNEQN